MELGLSAARLAALVALASDWIWQQDADGCFVHLSRHSGSSATDSLAALVLGQRLDDCAMAVDADDQAELTLCWAERLPFRNLRFRIRRTHGQALVVRLSGEPLFDDHGFAGYRGIGSDITAATLADQLVRRMASFDSLTGLPNRSTFLARLDLSVAQAQAHGEALALMFVDLDRFKSVNDTMGHDVGDELLRIVAQRLGGLLRGGDIAARLGGDEFVLLVHALANQDDLEQVAERVLRALAEPMELRGRRVQVSASLGIARAPRDGQDATTLLKHADDAMYLAKLRGKNNVQFFSPALAEASARRALLEGELRQAIEEGRLRLHFQPRFDCASLRLIGLEALVRWQHPQRGLLPPLDFIELAEDSDLIEPLGNWVLLAACHQIAQWRASGLQVPRCSINLSTRQAANGLLPETVRCALERYLIEPAALEIEITESVLMDKPLQALQVLRQLHALGVVLAIDDFGTGYSSLAYLKHFPAQVLKLDKTFVDGLPEDAGDLAISRAVIAMAHSLGLQVVAEGVETQAQLDCLRALQCDEVQGYLLARPLAAEALQALLPPQP